MDACVVFMSRPERTVAVSGFIDSSRRAVHEFRIALVIVEVDEREGFVWQHQSRAAVDDVVNENSALSQSISKRLDFVGGAQSEVVICQPDACFVSLAQRGQQVADVQARTNIEEWFVKREIKLKHLAPRPGFKVNVTGHTEALYPIRERE